MIFVIFVFPCFLVFLTTLQLFFDQTGLCPNLCEPSLSQNRGQWGCSSGQFVAHAICCSCLVFWATDLPAKDPHPVRDPTLCCVVCHCVVLCCVVVWCGVVWCVVWCVGAVCVQDFRGCVQDLGAPPDFPSAGPPPPTPPPPDRPKFRSFFPSAATIFILSSSLGGRFVEFWWCY